MTTSTELAALFKPLLELKRGTKAALREIAERMDIPFDTVKRKFYAFKKGGRATLVDRRKMPETWNSKNPRRFSAADEKLLRSYIEKYQTNAAAIYAMRRDLLAGVISSKTPIDNRTGYPRGWSVANLQRHGYSRSDVKFASQEQSAVVKERNPKAKASIADIANYERKLDIVSAKLDRLLDEFGIDRLQFIIQEKGYAIVPRPESPSVTSSDF